MDGGGSSIDSKLPSVKDNRNVNISGTSIQGEAARPSESTWGRWLCKVGTVAAPGAFLSVCGGALAPPFGWILGLAVASFSIGAYLRSRKIAPLVATDLCATAKPVPPPTIFSQLKTLSECPESEKQAAGFEAFLKGLYEQASLTLADEGKQEPIKSMHEAVVEVLANDYPGQVNFGVFLFLKSQTCEKYADTLMSLRSFLADKMVNAVESDMHDRSNTLMTKLTNLDDCAWTNAVSARKRFLLEGDLSKLKSGNWKEAVGSILGAPSELISHLEALKKLLTKQKNKKLSGKTLYTSAGVEISKDIYNKNLNDMLLLVNDLLAGPNSSWKRISPVEVGRAMQELHSRSLMHSDLNKWLSQQFSMNVWISRKI